MISRTGSQEDNLTYLVGEGSEATFTDDDLVEVLLRAAPQPGDALR